jgi:hypothetical protein
MRELHSANSILFNVCAGDLIYIRNIVAYKQLFFVLRTDQALVPDHDRFTVYDPHEHCIRTFHRCDVVAVICGLQ